MKPLLPLLRFAVAGLAAAFLSGCVAMYDDAYYDDYYYDDYPSAVYSSRYRRPYYYYDHVHHRHVHGGHYRDHRHSSGSSRSREKLKLVQYREKDPKRNLPKGYHTREWYQNRGYSLKKNAYVDRDGDRRGHQGSGSSSKSSKSSSPKSSSKSSSSSSKSKSSGGSSSRSGSGGRKR